jgi:hypothetical protein
VKPSDTADLLGLAAFYDNRTVDASVIAAWHDALGDLDRDDAITAVRAHYSESTDWLMPAHVRTRVRKIRADRAVSLDQVQPPPDLDPDDVPAYLTWLRRELETVAGGGQPTIPPQGTRTMRELPAVEWPKPIPPRENKVGAEESRKLAAARAEVARVRKALAPSKDNDASAS